MEKDKDSAAQVNDQHWYELVRRQDVQDSEERSRQLAWIMNGHVTGPQDAQYHFHHDSHAFGADSDALRSSPTDSDPPFYPSTDQTATEEPNYDQDLLSAQQQQWWQQPPPTFPRYGQTVQPMSSEASSSHGFPSQALPPTPEAYIQHQPFFHSEAANELLSAQCYDLFHQTSQNPSSQVHPPVAIYDGDSLQSWPTYGANYGVVQPLTNPMAMSPTNSWVPRQPKPLVPPGAIGLRPEPLERPLPSRAAQHSATRETLRKEGKASKPKRRGPLNPATRDKVEEMRDMSACWRCRKYKKSCNGPGTCDSCLIPKFKIWPSAIGCRRENLESMVRFLLPVQLEEGLGQLPSHFQKRNTWRVIPPAPDLRIQDVETSDGSNRWVVSKKELLATRLFYAEYLELADIAMNYQRSLPQPHKCLDAACELLIATCNWYKCVVIVQDSPPSTASIVECGTAVRNTTRKAFSLLQQTCLSTKRTDWFPAFLSALLVTCGAVYFMDTVMNIPPPARDFIWHDINNTRNDLRSKSYALVIDLLRASTKGINPITMDCWATPPAGKTTKKAEKIRAKEREVLLGSDQAALNGLLALKAWQTKYQHHLNAGKHMFANDLVEQTKIRPIAGVWKVFDI